MSSVSSTSDVEKKMKHDESIDHAILVQVLTLQRALLAEADETSMIEKAVQGLGELPGIAECAACVAGRQWHSIDRIAVPCPVNPAGPGCSRLNNCPFTPDEGWESIEIQTPRNEYGALFLKTRDNESSASCAAIAVSIAGLIALHIENNRLGTTLNDLKHEPHETIRKRIERLQETEEKYHLITENMADTVWIMDMNLQFIYVSPSVMRMYGSSPAELFERPIAGSLTPESLQLVQNVFAEEMELEASGYALPERTRILELEEYKKDGSIIWVESHVSFLRDENNKPIGVLGTSRDITDRKLAEQALERSQAELQAIYDHAPVMMCVVDEERRILYANPSFTNFTVVPEGQIQGGRAFDVFGCINAFDDPRGCGFGEYCSICPLRLAIVDTLKTGNGHHYIEHKTTLLREGIPEEVVLWGSTAMIQSGNRNRLLLCLHDITEWQRTEKALRESETNYRLLADNTLDAIWTMDFDWVFTYVNPACFALSGYTPEEWIGSRLQNHCDNANFDLITQRIAEEMAKVPESTGVIFDARMIKKNGESFPVEIRCNFFHNENGQLSGLQGTTRDITERKVLEAQLIQAQKMESVGRLAGGVAHDFNNMLSVILGHVELAIQQMDPTHPLHKDLIEIQKAAERSASLTRQLLGFARKQTVCPRLLDLNETIEGMLIMLRRLIGEEIILNWQPDAALWSVKMDPSQIDQILANLCINARDAIQAGGKVIIETKNSQIDQDYCLNHPGLVPGEYVLLTVSDDGCGMDKETIAHLFEPFFTTKEIGKGTGLGLATIYGIVKQNNGFIDVYSEPGQGSIFHVYLPRYLGKIEAIPKAPSAAPLAHANETILLVEDEPAILKMIATMLQQLGYKVLTAPTPAKAIRLASESTEKIDLIMTDVIMPEMNGRELANTLSVQYPAIKHLFMSGYTADVIVHHGVLEDGVHFIQKPFSKEDLSINLRKALGKRP